MPSNLLGDKEAIAKEGWVKEAFFEQIGLDRTGKPQYRKWKFTVDRYPCEFCGTTEHVYLKSMPQGIYKTCMVHQITQGPLPTSEGIGRNQKLFAQIIEDKNITIDEARMIAKRLGEWGRRPDPSYEFG